MNRPFFLLFLFFLSISVFAQQQVDASNRGISNAKPGDYIIRTSGEKVTLRQADIDYAKEQLGISTTQNNQSMSNTPSSNNYSTSTSTRTRNNNELIIFIVIISIAHIILTYCVYKMKGGYFACFYFFLAPLALLFLLSGLQALSNVGKKKTY